MSTDDAEDLDYEDENSDYLSQPFAWNNLAFIKDDTFLLMQGQNISIVDQIINQNEEHLRKELFETERTPLGTSAVRALTEMWYFSVYELLRKVRDRKYEFEKLHSNGGIDIKLTNWEKEKNGNWNLECRIRQLEQFRDSKEFREQIASDWKKLEAVYLEVELLRMNLAKGMAPGKDNQVSPAPGYARIHPITGSIIFMLVNRKGETIFLSRQEVATSLKRALNE